MIKFNSNGKHFELCCNACGAPAPSKQYWPEDQRDDAKAAMWSIAWDDEGATEPIDTCPACRLMKLEKVAHTPVDFTPYINKIRELEIRLARLEQQKSNYVSIY